MKNLGATHRNLDAKVYDQVKAMILEGKLVPGDKVFQDRLAQEMGVSRTPLVNALKVLEQEKLVKAIPRRGFFVRQFSKEEMIYIFELREVLEGLAARRAAALITPAQIRQLQTFFQPFKGIKHIEDYDAYAKEDRRFHNFITELGGREFLKSILTSYNVVMFSYQVSSYGGLVRHPDKTLREHLAIIKALEARDSTKAEEIMRLHLKRSSDVLRKDMEARENGAKKSGRDNGKTSNDGAMKERRDAAKDLFQSPSEQV
jgi:DNA-binding GntR family transcriptional regulator